MKPRILLSAIFAIAIVGTAIAGHVSTSLDLRMFNNAPIKVIVDGVQYGSAATHQEVFNLTPGKHQLKVFALSGAFGWHKQWVLAYRGPVEIYHGYSTRAFVDRYSNLVIENYEVLLLPPAPPAPCHTGNLQTSLTLLIDKPKPQPPVHCDNGWNPQGYVHPMNQGDFHQLLNVIDSKSFESTKVSIAAQAIGDNYFTSAQVSQLVGLFTFESSRLEVAKMAYNKVVDPEKFYIVYDAFTFESSIRDLQAHLTR